MGLRVLGLSSVGKRVKSNCIARVGQKTNVRLLWGGAVGGGSNEGKVYDVKYSEVKSLSKEG